MAVSLYLAAKKEPLVDRIPALTEVMRTYGTLSSLADQNLGSITENTPDEICRIYRSQVVLYRRQYELYQSSLNLLEHVLPSVSTEEELQSVHQLFVSFVKRSEKIRETLEQLGSSLEIAHKTLAGRVVTNKSETVD